MKIFNHEYENDDVTEISSDEFFEKICTFKREQDVITDQKRIQVRLTYARMHNLKQVCDIFENHNVVTIIHQDSDRDIYIVK